MSEMLGSSPEQHVGGQRRSILGRVALVVVGSATVLMAAGCSSSVDQHTVEKQVTDQLAAQVGQTPASVTCPGDLTAEVGQSMRCQLSTQDGTKFGVGVTVTAVQGSNVNFDIKVDDAPTP